MLQLTGLGILALIVASFFGIGIFLVLKTLKEDFQLGDWSEFLPKLLFIITILALAMIIVGSVYNI